MALQSDWTERYRPSSEYELEGNQNQRSKIRSWLEEWRVGTPSKKALLLIGPPGVGKTTIARAIANDMSWDVVELNASDSRNALAIRKAATHASTHRSLFEEEGKSKRTLILLDEVDHLSGGLREVSEKRVKTALMDRNSADNITGDSGGKAEVLRLLKDTKHPVIMACNDEMGLWGRNSSWRSTRDRFMRHLISIKFDRVSKESLKRISRRILKSEGYTIDPEAIDELVNNNPGDMRALVRDLQAMSSIVEKHYSKSHMIVQKELGRRDSLVEVFPGLQSLYLSRLASKSTKIIRDLDKSPDELISWISWNNAAVLTDGNAIARGSRAISLADKLLHSRFQNTAHRSWYWGNHLTALAASVVSIENKDERIFCSYPNFLRNRSFSTRASVIERLANTCGCSFRVVSEELLPSLLAIQKDEPQDFSISFSLELSAEEHTNISGLKSSHRSTKSLINRYNEALNEYILTRNEIPITTEIYPPNESREQGPGFSDGQTKLF